MEFFSLLYQFYFVEFTTSIGVGRSDVLATTKATDSLFFFFFNTLFYTLYKFHLKIPCTLFFLFHSIKIIHFKQNCTTAPKNCITPDLKWKQRRKKMSCYLITPHIFCVIFCCLLFLLWILFHSFTWCCFCFNDVCDTSAKACIYRIIVSHACNR